MDSRNRLWWVMGGVGLLLVVVLTGGLFWLSPVDPAARADRAQPRAPGASAAFEYVAGQPAPAPASAPEQSGGDGTAAIEVVGQSPVADPTAAAAGAAQAAPAAPPRLRVTLDEPAPAKPVATPAVRAIATTSARTAAAPAAVRTPAAAASPASEPAAGRSTGLAKLTPAVPLHEFWVQVGSFASRRRADALGQRLNDQGIVSRITTTTPTTGAEVFFRVRVGPYASRPEAEKFLAWVKQVDGMGGSYIAEVRNAGNAGG